MAWFWADSTATAPTPQAAAKCPIDHTKRAAPAPVAAPPPGCPMHQDDVASGPVALPSARKETSPDCPYDASQDKINPLNKMPENLPQQRISSHQSVPLPVDREISTIPKGDGKELWEYPSPQQMYNAMVRKGHTDAPAEHVERMVAVHNFLNEGAWQEILKWEQPYMEDGLKPTLIRFQGRSKELTPKAKMLQLLGKVNPSKYGMEPPFDRHDWFVRRGEKEVRYVIDYYQGPDEPTGEPVFYLDVRPALDTPGAAYARISTWTRETWDKSMGR
ncbi:holocytochrome c synthase [Saitoella coloradoensis]